MFYHRAMETYQRVVMKKHTHELRQTSWIQPKVNGFNPSINMFAQIIHIMHCRCQTRNKACGYYVMRHMLEIILLGSTEITAEVIVFNYICLVMFFILLIQFMLYLLN